MHNLNLPQYPLRTKQINGSTNVWDRIRKKFVSLTPEELVRQLFKEYLVQEKGFSAGLMAIEMPITVNTLKRRCDIVMFDQNGNPIVIVECKAQKVKITQKTIDQVCRYNIPLQVEILMVTNGVQHFCLKLNENKTGYVFLKTIPSYQQIRDLP